MPELLEIGSNMLDNVLIDILISFFIIGAPGEEWVVPEF